MPKIPDVSLEVWKELYAAASKFAALKPWDYFDDSTIFGIHDPSAEKMNYACILGALGELPALCVYRGAEGFNVHQRMQKGDFHRKPEESMNTQNCLMAEFADRGELQKLDLDVIHNLGLRFRGPKAWPLFRSYLPGYYPWHLTQEEAVFLAFALRCACDAVAKVLHEKFNLEAQSGKVFCYFPKSGDPQGFETRWEPQPIYRPQPPAPLSFDAGKASAIAAGNLKPDGIWEADVALLPAPIMDRERPYLPRFVLVADQASCFLIHSEMSPPETPPHQVLSEGLLKAIEKSKRLPVEIQLRDEAMVTLLAPVGKALGIRLKAGGVKVVRDARKELENYMRTGELSGAEPPKTGAGRRTGPKHRKPEHPAAPRATERHLFDLARAIREQEFESDEELDEWLEQIMSSGDLKKAPPQNALEVAQSVMYEAWETEDPDRRIELAERALAISPDCADAYSLLAAEKAGSADEELVLYRKAVEAGERFLGPDFFKENAGHFWGMTETRPYMRARAELARSLWELHRHDEALKHYYELLRLNTSDNQGIRYVLLSRLGKIGRFEEMHKFMSGPHYQDDCAAEWLYTKALLAFAREGSSPGADAALQTAIKYNKHVPDYLTGKKPVPRRLPDRMMMGGEDEGYCYAAEFLDAWKQVPGVLDWLKAEAGKYAPPKAGRNDPCPCGSGKKFKKCCGNK